MRALNNALEEFVGTDSVHPPGAEQCRQDGCNQPDASCATSDPLRQVKDPPIEKTDPGKRNHYCRSQLERVPSCCRSVVIRPFRLKNRF